MLPLSGLRAQLDRGPLAVTLDHQRPGGGTGQMRDARVPVVEDDYLIGQETAHALQSAGCVVTGPVGTANEALRIAVSEELEAAVLDISLGAAGSGRRCERSRQAESLSSLRAAIREFSRPSELKGSRRIPKLVAATELVSTLSAAIADNC